MARYLPTLEATEPSSTADTHAQVRGWMESITSFSPFQQIDYGSYSTVLEWSSRPDLLPIVLEVIKKRLEQKGIGGDKAIILAQVLPTSALLTLVDPLKKLATPPEDSPHTLHTNIASHLLSQAETLKADNDKADLEFKWNAWAEVYGKPSGEHQFPPLPKEVEWGMWGLVPVTPEQWWTVPKEEAEDKA